MPPPAPKVPSSSHPSVGARRRLAQKGQSDGGVARVVLQPHPALPPMHAMRLDADVAWSADGCLQACFTLRGDLSTLQLPRRRQGRRRDGLWRSTCFEVFVAAPAGERYLELNFSPSGDWAAYGFRRYRSPGPVRRPALRPVLCVARAWDCLTLDIKVDLHLWIAPVAPRALRLGLAAVVEDTRGSLSYWALHHAAERPDFHRIESLVLRLHA